MEIDKKSFENGGCNSSQNVEKNDNSCSSNETFQSYSENFKQIENFSKNRWIERNINASYLDESKEKCVVLDFFPYPSGVGLHVGHTLGYIATDIYARYQKLRGKNVLFAMGYDAFGLPAEQFAIEHGIHPEITTKNNIENIAKQLQVLGLSHDLNRSFSTTDKDYYKWTQWIFIQLYNSYFDENEKKAKPIQHLEERLRQSGLNDDEIYKKLEKERLAYLDEIEVNWCPKLGTVLSDEEVINGKSERGDHPVIRKALKQWMMRITKYSQRLVDNLDHLNWPISVKEMQRNWVGVSSGHEIIFNCEVNGSKVSLTAFTTRADTLSGVTFCAISSEHPDIEKFCANEQIKEKIKNKILESAKAETHASSTIKKDQNIDWEIFTGAYAKNPLNGSQVPIYVASYVLAYGTCAVMGVPAHDARDYKMAKRQNLDIIAVVKIDDEYCKQNDVTAEQYANNAANYPAYEGKSSLSMLYNGRTIEEEITWIESQGSIQKPLQNSACSEKSECSISQLSSCDNWIKRKINTKLRDWIFSRQRYWGEPFPIVLDSQGRAFALEESALPLELPDLEDFAPVISDEILKPLDRAKIDNRLWKDINFIKLNLHTARIIDLPEGSKITLDDKEYIVESGQFETNTMPNWAGSCWYFIRYMDPRNNDAFVGSREEKYWSTGRSFDNGINTEDILSDDENISGRKKVGALDLYLGGAEHAVLHLLYARFWYMVLYDLGYVSCIEPFDRLFNQGMILGASYKNADGKYFAPNDIAKKDKQFFVKDTNEEVFEFIGKIGKRYKNGMSPEEVTNAYSIDALRLYMMYLGPLEQSKPWDYSAIKGMFRVLEKINNLQVDSKVSHDDVYYNFNEMLKKVSQDFKDLKFNTAIAAIIIFINNLSEFGNKLDAKLYRKLLIVIAPLAPHLCEYLYQNWFECSAKESIMHEEWPAIEEINIIKSKINVVFTVNGKKRLVQEFDANITRVQLEEFIAQFASKNDFAIGKCVIVNDKDNYPKLVNIVLL